MGKNRYLNVGGATKGSRARGWEVLDLTGTKYHHPSACINYDVDLRKDEKWPIRDNTFKLIYSGHTLEHISPTSLDHVLDEIFRVMIPGGMFRVQVPDNELYWKHAVGGNLEEAQRLIVNVATALEKDTKTLVNVIRDVNSMNMKEFCDKYSSLARQVENPSHGGHLNWFVWNKLEGVLSAHGFTDIRRGEQNDSEAPEMRGRAFDRLIPKLSLYAECKKPTNTPSGATFCGEMKCHESEPIP